MDFAKKKAIDLFNEYKLDEARNAFEEIERALKEDDMEVLLYLGKIHSRIQNYGTALNYFNRVLDINTENKQAQTGKKLIQNILNLTNNYYYENPYTDDGLYET